MLLVRSNVPFQPRRTKNQRADGCKRMLCGQYKLLGHQNNRASATCHRINSFSSAVLSWRPPESRLPSMSVIRVLSEPLE